MQDLLGFVYIEVVNLLQECTQVVGVNNDGNLVPIQQVSERQWQIIPARAQPIECDSSDTWYIILGYLVYFSPQAHCWLAETCSPICMFGIFICGAWMWKAGSCRC